jgi:putative flippase GtrA
MRFDAAFVRKFLTFGCIGGGVYVFDASCFWLFIQLTGWPSLARVISVALAMTLSWWLNRTYTFRMSGPINWGEMLKFMLSQLPGACINALFSLLAFHYLPFAKDNTWIATAVGSCAGLVANFTMAHLFVFNKNRNA